MERNVDGPHLKCLHGGNRNTLSFPALRQDFCIKFDGFCVLFVGKHRQRKRSSLRRDAVWERKQLHTLNGALERIYLEYRQQLFSCALSITRRSDLADDAIQEAFYRLFRLDSKPRHLKAYVFRTVRNAAVDQVRRNPAPAEELGEFIFDRAAGPRDRAVDNELKRQAAEALLALSEDERETIVQHIYGNLTFREIARVREAPLGTVVTWYRRGLKKLRDRLEE
jgi:RNA polymerase sigma-70 factor (ECF subfamily)